MSCSACSIASHPWKPALCEILSSGQQYHPWQPILCNVFFHMQKNHALKAVLCGLLFGQEAVPLFKACALWCFVQCATLHLQEPVHNCVLSSVQQYCPWLSRLCSVLSSVKIVLLRYTHTHTHTHTRTHARTHTLIHTHTHTHLSLIHISEPTRQS